MKKKAGVWIDKRHAYLFLYEDNVEKRTSLTSDIDEGVAKGGARSKQPYGPMDKISEQKIEDRHDQQLSQFLVTVLAEIGQPEELLIFGPAEVKKELFKKASQHHHFKDIPITVLPADQMTENQMGAMARDFLGIPHDQVVND